MKQKQIMKSVGIQIIPEYLKMSAEKVKQSCSLVLEE